MLSYLLVTMTLAVGQVEAGPAIAPGVSTAAKLGSPTTAPIPAPQNGYLPATSPAPPMLQPPVLPASPYISGVSAPSGPTCTLPRTNQIATVSWDAGGSCPSYVNDPNDPDCFLRRLWKAYAEEFTKKDDRWEKKGDKDKKDEDKKDEDKDKNGKKDDASEKKENGNGKKDEANGKNGDTSDKKDEAAEEKPEPFRRAMPQPWSSPPFPGHEYQGYPLIGVPEDDTVYPLMKAIYGGPWGDEIKDSGIKLEGWVTGGGNWSTAHNSNTPTAYWVVPNHLELDQAVVKLERIPDTVQQDHIDWGFRSVGLFGIDYRYTNAGGWGNEQFQKHNLLNGWDPVEQYFNVYVPGFLGGTDIRVGRWIACPDIETQYSVDNYMASHSLLFTYDTYTQTGVMLTQNINQQWMFQAVIHAGTDMAPWYQGAIPTGAFGIRWVAKDNNDAIYAWLNAINDAEFRHFTQDGQPSGHDNFNYFVATWEHRFNENIHTKTEGYYMWQYNAELGGTPSLGPVQPYGGGGGDGILLPGLSQTYGILNYTMFAINKQDYVTLRNEWFRDERGMRSGYAGTYTSHTIGLSHNFNSVLQIRPEIGYYRNWDQPAFDLGTKNGLVMYGFDVTWRF